MIYYTKALGIPFNGVTEAFIIYYPFVFVLILSIKNW